MLNAKIDVLVPAKTEPVYYTDEDLLDAKKTQPGIYVDSRAGVEDNFKYALVFGDTGLSRSVVENTEWSSHESKR